MMRNDYLRMREEFAPEHLSATIVCESPPKSGKYFFDPEGDASEPLFRAIMSDVLSIQAENKSVGLLAFQKRGLRLVDVTYDPVNGVSSKRVRDQRLLDSYDTFKQDLRTVDPTKKAPILLVKANVCRLFDARLVADGFNVINRNRLIYFPSSGQQGRFRQQVQEILLEWPDLLSRAGELRRPQ